MGQWEWIILLLIGLGFLVWELISVRRSIRQAREADAPPPASPPPASPTPRHPER